MAKVDPRAETYADVVNLIHHTVHRFNRQFHGDYEEQFAEANFVFMHVYDTYEESRGSFTNLLVMSIWRRLTDVSVIARRKSIRTAGGDAVVQVPSRPSSSFSLSDFLCEISEDAKVVVQLVVEAPSDLAAVAEAKGDTACNWRSTIRDYLRSKGWHRDRINAGFEEVRHALP